MNEAIKIVPLPDPVIDTLGHDPCSAYPEQFWLPTLGPATLLLLRHIARRFDRAPEGFSLDLAETSRRLGLGDRPGRSSPLARSLGRMVQFDLAVQSEDGTLAVRRRLPPINRRHIRRLPPSAQEEHDVWVRSHLAETPLAASRRNARRTALLLFGLGDAPDEVEHALGTAGFNPAVASEAACWAWEELTSAAERDVKLA